MLAGALMLAVLMANSVSQRHAWWMTPNVLGSTFYGGRALRAGAGLVTLSGVALHLLLSGLIGGLFAVACFRILKTRRLTLFAFFVTMLWYFLAYQLIWARINPLVPLYATEPSTAVAHMVFAFTMGRSLRGFLPATGGRATSGELPMLPMAEPPAHADRGAVLALPEPPAIPSVAGHENQTAPEGPVRLE